MVTQGLWRANSNKQLAAAVKSIYRTVKDARTVYFSHVKGHSNHKWNDAADKLANKARTSSSKQKWEKQERVINSRKQQRENKLRWGEIRTMTTEDDSMTAAATATDGS